MSATYVSNGVGLTSAATTAPNGDSARDIDLFGPMLQLVGGGMSKAGRPSLSIRLMVSPLYRKHAYDLSDEGLFERWSETPSWQYFSCLDYFENRLPCDPKVLVQFRKMDLRHLLFRPSELRQTRWFAKCCLPFELIVIALR